MYNSFRYFFFFIIRYVSHSILFRIYITYGKLLYVSIDVARRQLLECEMKEKYHKSFWLDVLDCSFLVFISSVSVDYQQ